jgi:carboxyl-terminal processing protease
MEITNNGKKRSVVKTIIYTLLTTIFIVGVFAGGVFLGYENGPSVERVTTLFNKEEAKPAEVDFSPFWKVWSLIDSKYVSNNGPEDQERVWGAIGGLVASLNDPYSVFFPPQESKMFEEDISGNFGGVGMEIGIRNSVLTVIAPLKDTPAFKAGIKAGDQILKIGDVTTLDMTTEKAASIIRGEKGTPVTLTILHKGENESVEITMIRDTIKIPTLETEEKENGIFVIKMYNFGGNSISEFRKALREFAYSGKDKLILDLRGNPGGYLESAVDVASWFLPSGKVVAREKFGDGEEKLYRSSGYDAFRDVVEGLPFVILVNQGSASASEIVAGALQDHGVATIVGEKTFGKGSVQELLPVTTDTSLKITIARWLTPEGNSISKEGLEPDVKVEITSEDVEEGNDPQMDKAIEILLAK